MPADMAAQELTAAQLDEIDALGRGGAETALEWRAAVLAAHPFLLAEVRRARMTTPNTPATSEGAERRDGALVQALADERARALEEAAKENARLAGEVADSERTPMTKLNWKPWAANAVPIDEQTRNQWAQEIVEGKYMDCTSGDAEVSSEIRVYGGERFLEITDFLVRRKVSVPAPAHHPLRPSPRELVKDLADALEALRVAVVADDASGVPNALEAADAALKKAGRLP